MDDEHEERDRTGTSPPQSAVWGSEGKSQAATAAFFEELGPERTRAIKAVSLDMGPAFAKSTRKQAPQAQITIDPFQVVNLGSDALEEVRRSFWQQLRTLDDDQQAARKFKGDFCKSAASSGLDPFIRLAKTIRKHSAGILDAVPLGINNARTEALNNNVRLITRRAYGFHSPQAALALINLTCGPIDLKLPFEVGVHPH